MRIITRILKVFKKKNNHYPQLNGKVTTKLLAVAVVVVKCNSFFEIVNDYLSLAFEKKNCVRCLAAAAVDYSSKYLSPNYPNRFEGDHYKLALNKEMSLQSAVAAAVVVDYSKRAKTTTRRH